MPQEIIKFETVSYYYPREKKRALENLNLSITQGEFLSVMGKNGAGKTTFCKLINGIIPHSAGGRLSGTVTVDGENTLDCSVPRLALKVGMVLDDPDIQVFTASVRSEAAFGLENLLLPPEEIERRVTNALLVAGLAGFEQRLPATLSGGEKQRLAIACALAMNSKIIVLDEPLSRLDREGADEVMSVLKELQKNYGITVIMATHNSAKAKEFADRVLILNDGLVAACGAGHEIFADKELLSRNGIQYPKEKVDIDSIFTVNKEIKTEAIKLKDFCYSYDASGAVAENINLTICDNDFIAIAGRNGCGKTTLLKNITGLLRPASGEIYINGKNTKYLSVSSISKEVCFVMQNPDNQLFTNSVYNEVSFALKNTRLLKTEIKQRVEDALRAVGLENPDAFPHALSRAEQTLTLIACVLATGCKIIILDEVDVGQDYNGTLKIMNIAKGLHAKGYTVIFVTHNESLALEYSERLIMLDGKGIIFDKRRENPA